MTFKKVKANLGLFGLAIILAISMLGCGSTGKNDMQVDNLTTNEGSENVEETIEITTGYFLIDDYGYQGTLENMVLGFVYSETFKEYLALYVNEYDEYDREIIRRVILSIDDFDTYFEYARHEGEKFYVQKTTYTHKNGEKSYRYKLLDLVAESEEK